MEKSKYIILPQNLIKIQLILQNLQDNIEQSLKLW